MKILDFMKATGRMTKEVEMALSTFQMEAPIWVSMTMVESMEKVYMSGLTKINTMGNGQKDRKLAMESGKVILVTVISGNGLKI